MSPNTPSPQRDGRRSQAPEPQVGVLLVDDYPESLLALEATLAGLGPALVRASSAEDALKRVLEQDFATILMDVQMPGIDGFEAAALIRKRDRNRETPIIFLTTFDLTIRDVERAYQLGSDLLQKPVAPLVLRAKVAMFVDLYQKSRQLLRQNEALLAEIAERRRMEDLFAEAQRIARLGGWELDLTTCAVTWTAELFRIWGLEPGTAAPQFEALHDMLHPDDLAAASLAVADSRRTARPFAIYFRVRRPDGQERTLYHRGQVVVDAMGVPLRMVGITQDVTESRQAEQALRLSDARYQALVRAFPEPIIVTNPEQQIVLCNPRAAELLDYESADALVGCCYHDMVVEEERDDSDRIRADVASLGAVHVPRRTMLTRGGERLVVQVDAALVRDPAGGQHGFLAVLRALN